MYVIIMHLRDEQWLRYVKQKFNSVYDAMTYLKENPCFKPTKIVHLYFEHLYTIDFEDVILTNKRADNGDNFEEDVEKG